MFVLCEGQKAIVTSKLRICLTFNVSIFRDIYSLITTQESSVTLYVDFKGSPLVHSCIHCIHWANPDQKVLPKMLN